MKKIVPAVFFQKHLDGAADVVKKPARLELFDSELQQVTGGRSPIGGGIDTFSGSAGWLDVMQADDCG